MRRRALLSLIEFKQTKPSIPNNEIWYTTSDGGVITLVEWLADFGASIISNSYVDGQCVISFDGPVTKIGDYIFDGQPTLTSITIPDSVTTIGGWAFNNCNNLTSITIPNSVTNIGTDVFYGCDSLPVIDNIRYADTCLVKVVDRSLTSYSIKEGTRFIGNDAFNNCDNYITITLPDSVTTIGGSAFYFCDSLKYIYCKAITPPSLGGLWVFDYNASDRKIYVPKESVNAYKTEVNWSKYADAIVGYSF